MRALLREVRDGLAAEFRALDVSGPRGAQAMRAVAAVLLATLAALALHTGQPGWAAISAFRVTGADRAASFAAGGMRAFGSLLGALAGLLAMAWFATDPLALSVVLFGFGWLALFGVVTGRHVMAWLFFGITGTMVVLATLAEPTGAVGIAISRVVEVSLGVVAARVVAVLLRAPPGGPAGPAGSAWAAHPPLSEAWFADRWPAVLHACRGGLTVMLLPWIAGLIPALGPAQMAITAVAVLSVPAGAVVRDDRSVVLRRSLHRVVGCLAGSLVGLLAVMLTGADLLVWLLAIALGVWLGVQIQSGPSGVGYVGTQATLALLMTLIQGGQPPASLSPGFARLAGMSIGLLVLSLITVLLPFGRRRGAIGAGPASPREGHAPGHAG